jgi:hypothetical protein
MRHRTEGEKQMSVIAWDGKRLAADKRASIGTLIRTTTKVFHLGDALAAYSGDADAGEEVLAWFKDGHDPAKFPDAQRNRDIWAGLLIVWADGTIWKYERTPYPLKFPPQQFAIGSGRDFALAAMHCGKTAPEAVEVASVFCSGCGNGVDVLTHNVRANRPSGAEQE